MLIARQDSADLVARFSSIPPATIGHARDHGFADVAIRPIQRRVKMVGPCVTLKLPPGDATDTRAAIDTIRPGDVLVIDHQGETQRACWGEMTSLAARTRGAAGVIVDGAVTDTVEIEEMGLPTFARAISALVSRRTGLPGSVNNPIMCGGVEVHPGDLVVADENGVVFIRPDEIEELYALARPLEDRTPWLRQWLARGGSLQEVGGLSAEEIRARLNGQGAG